jgi:hypothetical protein
MKQKDRELLSAVRHMRAGRDAAARWLRRNDPVLIEDREDHKRRRAKYRLKHSKERRP